MTLKFTDYAKQQGLTIWFSGGTNWASLTMHLYQNNYTPDHSSVDANFTEADFTGYTAQSMVFSSVNLDGSFLATAAWTDVTFSQSGTSTINNIYGYYVKDGSGNVLWGERNPSAPVAMDTTGLNYIVSPKFTDTNASPP